jgi:TctA family transporter
MTNALFDGLLNVLSFPNILYVILGTSIAMVVSFLPGIGMISIASIFLLISTYWPTDQTLVFFGAIVGGATFMGSVTGILFNVPGSTPSAAILLDGYPLAQRGYPKKALAAAATASAVGSIFGVVVLISILPLTKDYLLLIGPI